MKVLLCWPTDPAEIARLNQFASGDPFSPTDQHAQSCCDACGCEVYLTLDQLQHLDLLLWQTRKLCFQCAFGVQRAVGMLRL